WGWRGSYDELEFDFRQLVVTDSIGSNVRLVVDDGLSKIANYSLGENAAGMSDVPSK
ncbi:hypothetical protein scyTo_0022494, partial [Scyliorhinus torazame]|nr:hypothetical protein [Scyliorhinus torazame]